MSTLNSLENITIIPEPKKLDLVHLDYAWPTEAHAGGAKIALISAYPTSDEIKDGRWLAGARGDTMFRQLKLYGFDRNNVFLGGLSRRQPENAHTLCIGGLFETENQELRKALEKFQPNIIIGMGDDVLRAATSMAGKRNKKDLGITKWRGSVIMADLPIFKDFKFIGVEELSEVFFSWGSKYPLWSHDIKRAAKESHSPNLIRRPRNFRLNLTVDQLILEFERLCTVEEVSIDIEGYITSLECISFSEHPEEAFILPWSSLSQGDQRRIFPVMAKFLRSRCRKVLQNGQYDNFVLSYTYGCFISNIRHDTMVAAWEIYPELPRALALQLSLWTDIPYYKDERESESVAVKHAYCCTDSAGTKELAEVQRGQLEKSVPSQRHFAFNMALLPGIMYLQLRGIRYWAKRAEEHLHATRLEIAQVEKELDSIVNRKRNEMLLKARENQSLDISKIPPKIDFNPGSSQQVIAMLYDTFKYPKQYSRPTKAKPIPTLTSDTPSLLELKKYFNGPEHRFLDLMLRHRFLETKAESLEWKNDADGRIRASYDCCGTVTGRFSCKKSPMNTGANLQTATKNHRHLFRADDECDFFNVDLSGADGWTVAAWCKALGDSTMFEDYLYGLKPAKLIALMYKIGDISQFSRAELKVLCEPITDKGPEGWLYFSSKRVQHGTNYGLGLDTMGGVILKDSHKLYGNAIVVSKDDCRKLQQFYLKRYPGISKWQAQCKEELKKTARLSMSTGHTRKFFGRREDHATYREWLSTEPQAITTYATNMAFLRLWTDPENRIKNNPMSYSIPISRRRVPFHVEPLHQVHDALNGQWPKAIREWSIAKVRSWFENPVTVAGLTFVIPFEGAWGPSWEEVGPKYGGGII